MILSRKVIAAAILITFSSTAIANTDSADIEINITEDVFVNFTGNLANNVNRDLTVAQVNGTVTTLGNLGTESNSTGACDIDISSVNDFRLRHNVDANLYLHATNRYSINYSGRTFTSGSTTLNLVSCNNIATLMQIATPGFDASKVVAGTYSDILTVSITTQ